MLNSAKLIAISSLIIFVVLVCVLSMFGSRFLKQVAVCDATVSYLDLARQADDQRNYARADQMFKQALSYARIHDPSGQAESAMLFGYAKFAYEKEHNKALAMRLEARAQELKHAAAARIEAGEAAIA